METRFYQTQDIDLQQIAQTLVSEFQAQEYEAQQSRCSSSSGRRARSELSRG